VSDQEVTVRLNLEAGGDAASALKQAGSAAEALADAEEKYQKILKGRIEQYHLAARLKTDMAKAGIGRELSDEEKYQQLLKGRLESLGVARRLKEDMARATGERELSHEEKYQKALRGTIAALEQRKRMQGDLDRLGYGKPKEDPFDFGAGGAAGRTGRAGGAAGLFGTALKLSAAAAAAAAARHGLDSVTAMGEIANQGNLTAAQKRQGMGEALPFGVGAAVKSLREFRDMIDGVNERLRRQGIKYADRQLEHQLATNTEIARTQAAAELFGAGARADALRGVRLTGRGGFDRSTLAGAQAYADEQQLVPLKDQAARAEAEAAAAAREERQARSRFVGLEIREGQLGIKQVRDQDRAEGLRAAENFGGPRTKALRDEAERRHNQTNLDLLNLQKVQTEEMNRLKAMGLATTEKEAAASRARLAVQQAELSVLQAREQRIAGNSQRIGGLHAAQRMVGLNAAMYLQKHGLRAASPDLISAAEQFVPGYVGKLKENYGEKTAEYREAARLGLLGSDTQSLKDTRQAVDKLQAQVDVNIHLNEQTMADAIVRKLEATFRRLIDSLAAHSARTMREAQIGRQIQNNQQN
jgi:hypothetical protein